MPQSRFNSPRPIAARSPNTFSTSGWTLTPSGTVVMRVASRFNSASGTAVSAASVHFRFRNGIQSTAYLLLKFEITGSTVWRPASIASRKAFTISSPPSAGMAFCAASLSAYSFRVPGCFAIFLYISGCVSAGVSCSLCPSFR